MVQARVRIGTSTRDYFLPLMQDIEFYSYINQMQNVREYMGTVAAAGNGQFNRLSAMESLGEEPWSQCLLEDFDFSLRLLLQGWRTRLLQDENVYQQGVKNYKKYIKQRTRWVQGCIQCVPYLNKIIKSEYLSIPGKIEVTYFMMLPWIGLVSTLAMMFSWFLILYSYLVKSEVMINILYQYNTSELIVLLIIIFTIIYLPGLLFSIYYWKDTREGLLRCMLAGIFIPIYNMFQMPAVAQAVYRQMVGKNAWVKTERN
jgi:cellulose synthase/poly-beta-1,6-N-acetylglucosamine synthase-like glycosyltransferase